MNPLFFLHLPQFYQSRVAHDVVRKITQRNLAFCAVNAYGMYRKAPHAVRHTAEDMFDVQLCGRVAFFVQTVINPLV